MDYVLGDLISDYIYDSSVGTLDEHNGKFAVTPEYPNGTYAYFMTEDGSGNPVYPYAIGPRLLWCLLLFEGDSVPDLALMYSRLVLLVMSVLMIMETVSYIRDDTKR